MSAGGRAQSVLAHLERLRRAEAEQVRPWLPAAARILELGGGSGYQAALLAAWGYDVTSIDLADRPSAAAAVFPVQPYDGRHIPFPDASFDVVFSSSVLEHIPALPEVLLETRRVLKPGGCAVHVLPSATWRVWSSLAHYVFGARLLFGTLRGQQGGEPEPAQLVSSVGWRHVLLPGPHGAYGSALAELYYFSRRRWQAVFRRSGFREVHSGGNRLFYTGFSTFPRVGLAGRRRASHLLGSTCHVFVLRSDTAAESEP